MTIIWLRQSYGCHCCDIDEEEGDDSNEDDEPAGDEDDEVGIKVYSIIVYFYLFPPQLPPRPILG